MAVDSALSCVVVRPWIWVVVSAPNCVVERLPSAVVVRLPSCVAVSAPACVVVKAWTSVEVSAPICGRRQRRRPAWWSACRPGSSVRLLIAVVLRPGDLRGRQLGEVERVEIGGGQRVELRRGQALGLGRGQRAELRGRQVVRAPWWSGCRAASPSARWPAWW